MNTSIEIINELKKALNTELPASKAHIKLAPDDRIEGLLTRQWPTNAQLSAVTLLLFLEDMEVKLLLMKRTEDNGVHSGQISLPGGRQEPHDKSLQETAIREFFEETGVLLSAGDYLGKLSDLYIPPSNFIVQPFIAFSPKLPKLKPNVSEVKELHSISLADIFGEKAYKKEEIVLRQRGKDSYTIKAPCYKIKELCIWGATAMIICELQMILEKARLSL
jgi:8-oxo-dGTP pyrophosphatase MutT (NUDIX family)